MKTSPSDAGSVFIESGKLRFTSDDYGRWEVDLDDVVLLGEYTTQDGPMLEDHFFVVLSKRGEEFEIPVTASGADEMRQAICLALDFETMPKLTLNTDFSSRIMAPRSFLDQPLYIFETERKPLLHRIFSSGRMKRRLSDSAKSVLQSTL
jgi:hypothetical protein